MSYSFFGTCCNDHPQLFGCLKTILNQSIRPERIILVDSGDVNIEQEILQTIKKNKIKLVYIFKKMSRVESLNLALDMSFSKYSFRFDSRSRFAKDYAKNALLMLSDENLNIDVVGGVPTVIKSSNKFESKVCAEIMESSYLYFFPKHRNTKFNGYSSSIYLGCFSTKILKNIRFNEKDALISEDSLIIHDFLKKGFKAYISSNIKVSYVCRDSFLNLLKLFYTYGYCRANTILVSKKLFISLRHFFVFFVLIIVLGNLLYFSNLNLLLIPLIFMIFNLLSELILCRKRRNLFVPIYGTLCQFAWISGFLTKLLCIFRVNKSKSNFIS